MTARKELMIRAGLSAVAEVEQEFGNFTDEELADAAQWAREAIGRSVYLSPGKRYPGSVEATATAATASTARAVTGEEIPRLR